MFEFFNDFGNHYSRIIARNKHEDYTIDTCAVSDGDCPYETAIAHKDYNHFKWIIVEKYLTKEEAKIGHERWLSRIDDLPNPLIDCQNAGISKLLSIEKLTHWRNSQ